MSNQQFDVDEWVQCKTPFDISVRGKPVPTVQVAWHVIEVNAQTCSAGTQFWYTCRPHIPEQNRYDRTLRDWTGNELRKFNQIELDEYRPPEPETAEASGELIQKIIELIQKNPEVAKMVAEKKDP